jgi:branched-chain amino acid transport system permease protein
MTIQKNSTSVESLKREVIAPEHRPFSRTEWITYLGLLVALLLFPVVIPEPFVLTVAILTLMYATLALGWNFTGGLMGLPLFCSALFFGLGAYADMTADTNFGLSPWIGLVIGVLTSMAVAWILGALTLRLDGHYFGVATFVVGAIAIAIFNNISSIGGVQGMSAPIHDSGLYHMQWQQPRPYYYLFLCLLVLSVMLSETIHRSRLGLYLRAIKHNALGAAHLGVRVTRYRIFALMISAGVTSVAGSLYASYVLFIDPTTVFAPEISVQIVIIALLGGLGYTAGALIGAAVLIPLGQYLNAALGYSGQGWNLAIFGLAVILIVIFRPTGIVGVLEDASRLREEKDSHPEARE